MRLEWDLTELFKNKEDFYSEIKNIKKLLSNIKKYKDIELDANSFFEMLKEKWEIKELANNILVYGSLMYYKNIKTEECIKLKNDAEIFSTQVDSELNFIDNKTIYIGKQKVSNFISQNKKLEIYRMNLDNLFRIQEHILDDDVNHEIKGNVDNINQQINLYNNLLKDMQYSKIEINDKLIEITSSNFSKYLSSRDRKTRNQAYLIINQQFKKQEKSFANILNLIFGYRIKNAFIEKYNSVLGKVLFEENIDSRVIENLIKAVNNNLNLIQKYLKIKSNLLKIDEPHLYDFGVPLDSNIEIKYTFEDAIDIIKNALKPLGEKYLEVVDYLLNWHIDAIPNDNKHQSLTFSWHTYSFMNFRGTYLDLKNLIHEIGHIVNYYLSMNNLPFMYEDSTIFVGETASIINEILLNRYLYETAKSEEERLFYLSKEIENYFTSVFKQTMYTEFESDLYSEKLVHDLTPKILSEKYIKLIKKYYGKDIKYDDLSGIEWARLGHLYRWSYYPYKYATGLIIASVVVNALIDEQTLSKEEYIDFLSSGSSLYSLELLKKLNIDLTNSKTIENGFKILEKDIEELNKIIY